MLHLKPLTALNSQGALKRDISICFQCRVCLTSCFCNCFCCYPHHSCGNRLKHASQDFQIVFPPPPPPQLPHATVSCVECVSSALMFEQVLLSFFGAEAASLLPRSPSLSDFVRVFRQQCSESPAKQTRYIVSVGPIYTTDKDHTCRIRL